MKLWLVSMMFHFDCIECFMTTFLRAHSWLNWVVDDVPTQVLLDSGPMYQQVICPEAIWILSKILCVKGPLDDRSFPIRVRNRLTIWWFC